MPNQCITDIICATGKPMETSFELALERDILLADYDRPVFKIIKTVLSFYISV